MNLHENQKDFKQLISIVASRMHLPESAIERDYFIVLLLANLANSEYASQCVFKGGTSLSKCFPNSIERFSEDIDLTFLGIDKSDNYCNKAIKKIEKVIIKDFNSVPIEHERSKRSKSSYVWLSNEQNKIKLEIGCNVQPTPYNVRKLKSYIHEYLEKTNSKFIEKFGLREVSLNVLNIERTFIDKVMAVKRHALCNNLSHKVRHIYDVTKLYELDIIQKFLRNKKKLKAILQLTKESDKVYFDRRNIITDYNPLEPYDFLRIKPFFNYEIKSIYENLHMDLLYTTEKQNFDKAVETFEKIDSIFKTIDK